MRNVLIICLALITVAGLVTVCVNKQHEKETVSLFIVTYPAGNVSYLRAPYPSGWRRLLFSMHVERFTKLLAEKGYMLTYQKTVQPEEQVPNTCATIAVARIFGDQEGIFLAEARDVFGPKRPLWGNKDTRRKVEYFLWEAL